jgi:hypothetical protein
VGVYCAVRHCRSLPLYFAFGAAAGLFYVDAHRPGRNDFRMMSPTLAFWARLFLQHLGLCIGLGVLCGFVAAVRHRRLDEVAKRSAGRCGNCGYLLYGLPEPRCPECGEPFDPALLASERLANEDDDDVDSAGRS